MASVGRWIFLSIAMTSLCLVGCQSQGTQGSWFFSKPKAIVPVQLEVVRIDRRADANKPATTQTQSGSTRLTVNLTNGAGVFYDEDGKGYPLILDADLLVQLKKGLSDTSWMNVALPAKDASLVYNLAVADANTSASANVRPGKPISWSEPSVKPLPAVLTLIEDTLDRSSRVAHPLSDTIDLTH